MDRPLRVLIVDDHALFRDGLRFLLQGLAQTLEFHEADSLETLPAGELAAAIELVLLDYHLPGVSGLEGLTQIRARFEAARIVVISGVDDPVTIRKVIEHGAAGFIPKSSTSQVLVSALGLVIAGGTYLPVEILQADTDACQCETNSRAPLQALSDRQLEVLKLAIQGKANKVIARELSITDHTVKAHLSAALRTLGVKNRTEAVFAAAKWGLN